MKKSTLNLIILFSFFFINIYVAAQGKSLLNKTSKIAYAEKIYVQLNSTIFTSDKTIWLKAIVTNVNQIPTTLSNVLYVELIDFDERIVASKILKLEKGIADGFFDLQETIPLLPGKYMVRAYTKWNANFEENFISKQYINIYKPKRINTDELVIRDVTISEKENKQLELSAKVFPKIINPKFRGKLKVNIDIDGKKDSLSVKKDSNKEYTFNYLLPNKTIKAKIDVQLDSVRLKNNNFNTFSSYSKTIAIDKDFIDLQFFPEGGKLVDGLKSIIGFKALDYKNEGIPVKGVIKDENGFVITEFISNQLGMGFCQLKADKNKSYQAVISLNNTIDYKFQLPKIYEKGYTLLVKSFKDVFKLKMQSNFSESDSLLIKAQARGITYANTKVVCKNGKVIMTFQKDLFPEGIVTFTVFNKFNKPVFERLVFNYKEHKKRLKITSKTNKKRYQQRDKITFNIKIKDSIKSNTSFLVINKRQLGKMQLNRGNILSYFLLESELKGTIEQPNFYFDTNNKHRFYAMDALLLTQGWRNYNFKPTEEKIEFKQQPEKNLQISGTVEEFAKRKRKRKKPIELTLMTLDKKNLQVAVTIMDSLGRFSFNLSDVYNDDLEYLIQTKNHKGRKKELTINIDKPKPININFEKQEKLQLADQFNAYVIENIKRYAKENPFNVDENGFVLDEITVKTRLLSPIQKKMTDEHGEPDVIIEDKELKSKIKKWSYGLFSILIFNYAADLEIKTINSKTLGSFLYPKVYDTDFTFVFVDGIPVRLLDFPLLGTIPTDAIKTVEIIKFPKKPTKYFLDVFNRFWDPVPDPRTFSFLNIYSYAGEGLFGITETIGIFKNTLPSFSIQKEFYVPKHENLTKSDWELPDLRSTVFWQTNVTLDKNGTGKVEFYADDNIGEMLVIIESISDNGKLGYYETTYKVGKKG